MPSFAAILRCLCALFALTLAGCFSYTRYPYYPYNPYVPAYGAPAPLQPQLGPPTGVPTPVDPNSPNAFPPADGGSQFNNGSQLAPTPDSGNGFPPTNNFNPDLSQPPLGGQGGTGAGLVPNYNDPNNLNPANSGGVFEGGGAAPFDQNGASLQPDSKQSVSQVRYERAPQAQEVQLAAHQTSPIETWPVATDAPPAEPGPLKTPNPYGYDAVGYRWLRGVVHFDEKQHAWVIVYNPNPGPQDAYKGQLTLLDNGLLQKMQNDNVVLVEGQVDPANPEPGTGKPQYRVKRRPTAPWCPNSDNAFLPAFGSVAVVLR